jgi:hypothetical protein
MHYRELKKAVRNAINGGDRKRLSYLVENHPRSVSALLGLSYDKESVLTWRAIESIGPIVKEITDRSPGEGRDIVQRLIWSITEESGGIGWSAVEMLGEIVRCSPDKYSDIVPLIIELFGEEIFRFSVLHAICRIGDKHPGLLGTPVTIKEIIDAALTDHDPTVRGGALITLKCLKDKLGLPVPPSVKRLLKDNSTFRYYHEHEIVESAIGDLAEMVL